MGKGDGPDATGEIGAIRTIDRRPRMGSPRGRITYLLGTIAR
jgi:hypothetical protein